MIKKMRKNKKGFTLVEIIVVLVIMGILLAIAVPAILGYVSKANDAKYLAQARGGYLAAQTITAENASRGQNVATLDADALNEELGFDKTKDSQKDGFIKTATCTIADNAVTECKIQVEGMSDKYVSFTKDEAKVVKGSMN